VIHVGFIGCGGIAQYHARFLAQIGDAEIVAGCDPDANAIEAMAGIAGEGFAGYRDTSELLGHKPLDAVMVCSPTHLHAEHAITALQAGLHVFCEKPMARSMAQARALAEQVDKAAGTFTVGFVRRFDNQWNTMGQLIRAGELGQPVIWRFLSGSYRPGTAWFCQEEGGGPLLDGAIHNYDFMLNFFGPAKRALAIGQTWDADANTAQDTGTVILEMAGGDQFAAVWTWGIARGAKASSHQDILGPRGVLSWQVPPDRLGADFDPDSTGAFWLSTAQNAQPVFYPKNNMFLDQIKHWLDCVEHDKQPSVTVEDGIKALQVALAVLQAMKTGEPVAVDSVC